jgi:hypothetical protein
MDQVVTRFAKIKNKLSTWKLRSRMGRKNEVWPLAAWRAFRHWRRTITYVFTRKAAIPEPKSLPSKFLIPCIALFLSLAVYGLSLQLSIINL